MNYIALYVWVVFGVYDRRNPNAKCNIGGYPYNILFARHRKVLNQGMIYPVGISQLPDVCMYMYVQPSNPSMLFYFFSEF